MPPITGICRSISTTSNVSCSSSASASPPCWAIVTSCPRRVSRPAATRWLTTLSSTSSTRTRVPPAAIASVPAAAFDASGRLGRRRRPSAERAFDRGEQIGRVDRLGQIGRDAELGAARLIAVFARRGQHHHRGAGERGVGGDGLGDGETVHARHVRVEQDEVERPVVRTAAVIASTAARPLLDQRRRHPPAGDLLGQDAAVDGVVVDDQDVEVRGRRPRAAVSGASVTSSATVK